MGTLPCMREKATRERLVIGCMSGTSMDAVDAALVRICGEGLAMTVEFIDGASEPIAEERSVFLETVEGRAAPTGALRSAIHRLSERHAKVAKQLMETHGEVAFVAVHGQTLFHRPPLSWQAIEPWTIAHAVKSPVVFDLRAADLAAGGQGAPITPLADWIMFRDETASRAIVNLGGFCNVTVLPAGGSPETIRAFDVCACNQVLDAVARRALDLNYDSGGANALRGQADPQAVRELSDMLRAQRHEKRSLGAGDEGARWIDAWIDRLDGACLAASAAAGIGNVIGETVADAGDVFLAGGGAHSAALVSAMEKALGRMVQPLKILGIPGAWRESVAMAVLGCLCADAVPITLAQVTGVQIPPVAGSWVNVR